MKQTVLTFLVALAAGSLSAAVATNDYYNAELPSAKRIAAAKARGVRFGRPAVLPASQEAELEHELRHGASMRDVAERFGCSRTSVWRIARRAARSRIEEWNNRIKLSEAINGR